MRGVCWGGALPRTAKMNVAGAGAVVIGEDLELRVVPEVILLDAERDGDHRVEAALHDRAVLRRALRPELGGHVDAVAVDGALDFLEELFYFGRGRR